MKLLAVTAVLLILGVRASAAEEAVVLVPLSEVVLSVPLDAEQIEALDVQVGHQVFGEHGAWSETWVWDFGVLVLLTAAPPAADHLQIEDGAAFRDDFAAVLGDTVPLSSDPVLRRNALGPYFLAEGWFSGAKLPCLAIGQALALEGVSARFSPGSRGVVVGYACDVPRVGGHAGVRDRFLPVFDGLTWAD